MDKMQQRYFVEHEKMRKEFLHAPDRFMKRLEAGGTDFIVGLYNKLPLGMRRRVIPIKFHGTDFNVEFLCRENKKIALIKPPIPQNTMDCLLIGLSVQTEGNTPVYRTIERTLDGRYIFCEWKQDDMHVNHGIVKEAECPFEEMKAELVAML